MTWNMRTMVSKLTPTARRGLEDAAGLALMRGNYDVEIEHWFLKLLEFQGGDFERSLRHVGVAPSRVAKELTEAIERLRAGNGGKPQLAPDVERILRESWGLASINYSADRIRSGVLLLAALTDIRIRRRMLEAAPTLKAVDAESFARDLAQIVSGSDEDGQALCGGAATPGAQAGTAEPTAAGMPALDQFTVDLTAAAEAGRIDPVLGRDSEIRQIIDILMRRRQNNPILTGEAGVGKTAVVEGFALRVATGDVPEALKNVQIRSLDLGLLQAGAGVKGEFENRLKGVIDDVRGSARPIILFIDEAHTMIGAGGQEGQNDAANLLKPALARGELRTIAATTWAEYKRYFEKDAALSRRFQVVKVEEPDARAAIEMMRGLVPRLERHHGVRILDSAVNQSVLLSQRYLSDRQLPDKSVSVLDTACARIAMGIQSEPAVLESLRRRIDALEREETILRREQTLGASHTGRLADISTAAADAKAELAARTEHWAREKDLVARILSTREAIEATPTSCGAATNQDSLGPDAESEVGRRLGDLAALRAELAALQGRTPMVSYEVDDQTIAQVIAGWTGIPVGRMFADEIQTILGLVDQLRARIVGQDEAMLAIAERIRTSRANLDRPGRPTGVFLLVGPSGVGKTETATALAEMIYGGQKSLITINMSEYQEAHTVSGLKGSPPGYVGYGEGGVLTEAVRRRPHSVVLLDEVEKAHPDVMELFYQVFDKGLLEDGEGREIDFRNTVILLTSNLGSRLICDCCSVSGSAGDIVSMEAAVRPALTKHFTPALMGRMTIVPFRPLRSDDIRRIAHMQMATVRERVYANHRAELLVSNDVVDLLVERCEASESGARAVDHIIVRSLLPRIATELLTSVASGRECARIRVAVADGDFTYELS